MDVYPYYRAVTERPAPGEVVVDGMRAVNAASTDYLGLASDARVTESAMRAAAAFGASCSGSPLISGTLGMHRELEEELASFLRRPAVTLTTTGYQANLALACLFGDGHVVVADRHNHASLVDAVRLGRGMNRTFRHNDAAHLDKVLCEAALHGGEPPWVVTEGMFSVSGDLLEMPAVAETVRRHHAVLIVDGAHDIGVVGASGRGVGEHTVQEKAADVLTGTFSKAFGSVGGFVAGSTEVIHRIRHYGRSAVFSASMSPPAVAAARTALKIVRDEPEHRAVLAEVAGRLHEGLAGVGWPRSAWAGPVVTLPIEGGTKAAMLAWRALLDRGVFAAVFVPPAATRPLMRLSVTAAHTPEQVDRIVQAASDVLTVDAPLPGPRACVAPAAHPGADPPAPCVRS
ncbi:aminotransferase class I/II-fold pyridoxal phosphate-dependent enzyme [Streptomyces sp. NPDC053048]|uniref:aminotransferase class I/II-fold pyridoxal phosphate-dependent enzyme n=1 Tax=Streptomyces sp. NPDC053048 TaxID=3365694 RepID=UPI0037D58698